METKTIDKSGGKGTACDSYFVAKEEGSFLRSEVGGVYRCKGSSDSMDQIHGLSGGRVGCGYQLSRYALLSIPVPLEYPFSNTALMVSPANRSTYENESSRTGSPANRSTLHDHPSLLNA